MPPASHASPASPVHALTWPRAAPIDRAIAVRAGEEGRSTMSQLRVRVRPRRVGLLTRFAVLSAVLIGVIGLVVGQQLTRVVERRTLANAEKMAAATTQLLVASQMSAADLRAPIVPERRAAYDALFRDPRITQGTARLAVWDRGGTVWYATDAPLVGRRFPAGSGLRGALHGRVSSQVTHPAHMDVPWGRYPGRLLRVYVPLRLSDAPTAIAGVAELHFPYEPLAADITADTRQIMWWMLAGLTVLYLGLFRVVARASAQLRVQSRTNERLALHDALTGLPNRVLLKDRTTQALAAATRSGARVGLLLLDLDRFKEINDTLGHHCGDDLLVQVGPRLRGVLREADTIARLGGDEFVVLLPDLATEADAFAVADKLLAGLHEPFVLDGVTLDVEASMGVTVAPEHGDSFEVLLQRADIAMYVAKETHTGVAAYAPELDRNSPARLSLLGDLRRGLERDELVLHYQPKAELATGRVQSVEALARWQHPRCGLLGPGDFVPLAERTGLIRPLTLAVLDAALAQARAWETDGLALAVAVNVSACCLLDLDCPRQVADRLARYGVGADRLVIEITESGIMTDPARAQDVLTRLSELGIRLSIDDFGTGTAPSPTSSGCRSTS